MFPRSNQVAEKMKQALIQFKKRMNLEQISIENPLKVKVDVPGFSYSDFCRTGIPSIWAISKLLETGRLLDLNNPIAEKILPQFLSISNASYVLSAQRIVISHALYQRAAFNHPMIFTMRPGPVGNKSLGMIATLEDSKDSKLLVLNQRQGVYMNTETSKPIPLPETYQHQLDLNVENGVLRVTVTPVPEHAHSMTVTCVHSDTDQLQHVNSSVFIRYFWDVAADACLKGKLKGFKGDFFEYFVEDILVLYESQAFPGDHLQVYVWEHGSEKNTLKCQIYNKATKKSVFFASADFFLTKTLDSKL